MKLIYLSGAQPFGACDRWDSCASVSLILNTRDGIQLLVDNLELGLLCKGSQSFSLDRSLLLADNPSGTSSFGPWRPVCLELLSRSLLGVGCARVGHAGVMAISE